jgi:hypothetical protein
LVEGEHYDGLAHDAACKLVERLHYLTPKQVSAVVEEGVAKDWPIPGEPGFAAFAAEVHHRLLWEESLEVTPPTTGEG